MRTKWIIAALAVVVVTAVALADLAPWKDYAVSESVWEVTTVKVDSNMGDAYLEGIKNTWVKGNKISMELGHVEDYMMLRSDLPESGHFNLLLMVKYKNSAAVGPSQKRYDEFVKKWGEQNVRGSIEFAQKNYPAMRKITGQYYLREITLK